MRKSNLVFFSFMLTIALSSCGDGTSSKSINYPFIQIDTKKENRANDNSYNEMLLFTCGDNPSLDTLQLFCTDKKKDFTDGVFHIIVFFDKKENAIFPSNPVTGGYVDEKPAKHIKAIYTYNKANGYSKLDYYEKNSWESKPTEVDIQ